MALVAWALPRLSKLLPLDEDSLRQVISYTDSLSKAAAAEHLKNLLGDSAQALEFISSFNTRRPAPPSEPAPATAPSSRNTSESEVPKSSTRPRKKKQDLHKLPPVRRPEDHGNVAGTYIRRDDGDYMAARPSSRHHKQDPILADTLALQSQPDAVQSSVPAPSNPSNPGPQTSKLPPPAAGNLISEALPSRSASNLVLMMSFFSRYHMAGEMAS